MSGGTAFSQTVIVVLQSCIVNEAVLLCKGSKVCSFAAPRYNRQRSDPERRGGNGETSNYTVPPYTRLGYSLCRNTEPAATGVLLLAGNFAATPWLTAPLRVYLSLHKYAKLVQKQKL